MLTMLTEHGRCSRERQMSDRRHDPRPGELWQITRFKRDGDKSVVLVVSDDGDTGEVWECIEVWSSRKLAYGPGVIGGWSFNTKFDWVKVSDGA